MAELSKLLGFMSAWDRRDALAKYDALFDEAADEAELIETLGSPTKLAIGLALNYVPSAPPAVMVADTAEPDGSVGEFAAGGQPETPSGEASVGRDDPGAPLAPPESTPESSPAEQPVADSGAPDNMLSEIEEEPEPAAPRRKVRAFGLIASIILGLVPGVPVALVLICLGIPFIVLGGSLIALAVWAAMSMIGLLAMFSDVLIIVGAGLLLCALGLLLVWFGLWLSFELGYLWIGGVVLRLGRAMTYKKEVAAE